jgi:predicted Zn-dependent protease
VSEPVAAAPARLADRLRAGARDQGRAVLAVGAVVLAAVAAWQTLQPQRAAATGGRALDALAAGHADQARRLATKADDQDPLAVDALFDLAVIETTAGRTAVARGVLVQAVRRQPSNPDTWLRLADFEVSRDPKAALRAVGAALYLDPRSPEGQQLFLQATRAQGRTPDLSSLPQPAQSAPPGSGGNPAVGTDGTSTTP